MNCFQKTYLRFLTLFCLSSFWGNAQYGVPHFLYQQFNGPYDYTIIGKSHNSQDNWSTPPSPCVMQTNSSAMLSLAANQTIVGAYLVWSGIGNGAGTNLNLNGTIFTPDAIHLANSQPPNWIPNYFFAAIKDITSFVQNTGNGVYQVSNFNLNPLIGNYCSGSIFYSGWNIIIVYSNPTLPNKQLNIYDGFRIIGNSTGFPQINVNIANLNVTSTAGAKITYIAYNGSPNNFIGESVRRQTKVNFSLVGVSC